MGIASRQFYMQIASRVLTLIIRVTQAGWSFFDPGNGFKGGRILPAATVRDNCGYTIPVDAWSYWKQQSSSSIQLPGEVGKRDK